MGIKNTIVATVLTAVCVSAPAVYANGIPTMGRIGDFDYSECGFIKKTARSGEAPAVASGAYMGMSATDFCACVWGQVGEGVQQYLNCPLPE